MKERLGQCSHDTVRAAVTLELEEEEPLAATTCPFQPARTGGYEFCGRESVPSRAGTAVFDSSCRLICCVSIWILSVRLHELHVEEGC